MREKNRINTLDNMFVRLGGADFFSELDVFRDYIKTVESFETAVTTSKARDLPGISAQSELKSVTPMRHGQKWAYFRLFRAHFASPALHWQRRLQTVLHQSPHNITDFEGVEGCFGPFDRLDVNHENPTFFSPWTATPSQVD